MYLFSPGCIARFLLVKGCVYVLAGYSYFAVLQNRSAAVVLVSLGMAYAGFAWLVQRGEGA